MDRFMFGLGVILTALVSVPPTGAAQEAGPGESQEAIRVFLDCQSLFCDFSHLRREIPWVNWVRDREVAAVHVLGTSQRTGAGGRAVTLAFIGLRRYRGQVDTLMFQTGVTDTNEEERAQLTATLALGLARFAASTPLRRRLRITYDAPDTAGPQEEPHDPWNFWVFEVEGGGGINGEDRQRGWSLRGELEARRVTENWKFFVSTRGFHRRSEFDTDDTTTVVSERTSYGGFMLSAWSLGPHWSIGYLADLQHSTFDNLDLALEGGGAIEYSIFPYSESTRRAITFRYAVGAGTYNYNELTVFGRTAETRPLHELNVGVGVQQPWGSVHAGMEWRQFLHDLSKHRLDVGGGASLRLFRGLRFNIFGNVARVKDQLNLPAGDLTTEEILLQQTLLGTDFEYRTNISFSYTFGSIFNNVVNPRF